MNRWKRAARMLLDTLIAPRDWLAALQCDAPVGRTIVVLGALGAAQQLAQTWVLAPLVLHDSLSADAPGGETAALHLFWLMRIATIVAAPCGLALRSVALASVLHATGLLLGAAAAWRSLLSLCLHLEILFWIEGCCATLLLWLARPLDLESLQSLRLRAGLNMLWRPASEHGAALLEAANLFTVWWAVLLAAGLVQLLRLRRGQGIALAMPLWMALVGLRLLLSPS